MISAQLTQWYNLGHRWWLERNAREKIILIAGVVVVVLAGIVSLGEGVWRFYRTLPQQRALRLQREWLLEDVKWLEPSQSKNVEATASVSSTPAQFLAKANQIDVNGQCIAQGTSTWSCTGQSASLESVQQWWLSGRREGFYVERFEATAQSPGRVQWTMVVKK